MKNFKNYWLSSLITLILLISNTVFCQLPQFAGEKIEITIHDNYCSVKGTYTFRNNHSESIKRMLFYPFPIDSTLLFPDSIKISNVKKNKNISFVDAKTGIYFPIDVPAGKTVVYQVFYTQQTCTNKFEYILTSTQSWNRPLDFAEFIIKIPVELELKLLSYKSDSMEKVNHFNVYKFHKEKFMPTKNLLVEWARRRK